MQTKAAIIIPVFNTPGPWLERCVASALAQTVACEVVVVDDGSTEPGTRAALDRLESAGGVVLVRHLVNRGTSAALNTGLATVSAPVVLPVGSDDHLDPALVERCLPAMDDPDVGIVSCWLRRFGDGHGVHQVVGAPQGIADLLVGNAIPGTSLMRVADALQVGGFREHLQVAQDYDMWVRLIALGRRCVVVPEPLYHYRIHRLSATRRRTIEQRRQGDLAVVEANRDIWQQNVVELARQALVTKERLRSMRRRWGRLNGWLDRALDVRDRVLGAVSRSTRRASPTTHQRTATPETRHPDE